jgi:phage tail sheath gpL-like
MNGRTGNVLMGAVVAVTLALGVSGVLRAGAATLGGAATERGILLTAVAAAAVLLVPVVRAVRAGRRGAEVGA